LYYFSYSTNPATGMRIDYMTSSSPTSGYTYRGVIGGQPPSNSGNNNHHSDFELAGNWYHAYHQRLIAEQSGIATTYRRNLGLERLDFSADGAIQQVIYTTDGVTQLSTLNPYLRVEAETTNAQSGIETEPCSEGGMDVTNIDNGDFVKVRGVDFGAGAKAFSARVAAESGGGSIELHLDSPDGTLIGTCPVAATGGAQTWATATCEVTSASGVKDLYLTFTGGSSPLFSVNHWQFTALDAAPDPAGCGCFVAGSSRSAGTPVALVVASLLACCARRQRRRFA
jgi:arabinoxylan arabinofuranohydrolase